VWLSWDVVGAPVTSGQSTITSGEYTVTASQKAWYLFTGEIVGSTLGGKTGDETAIWGIAKLDSIDRHAN